MKALTYLVLLSSVLSACGDDAAPEADVAMRDIASSDVPFDMGNLDAGDMAGDMASAEDVALNDVQEDTRSPEDGGEPLEIPFPVMRGFGAATTGGQGGTVYPITSLSMDEDEVGTVAWALAQGDASDPRVLLFFVEGGIRLTRTLKIQNSNITFDGSFAPGVGAWFEGERVEFQGDNMLVQHMAFLGNDRSPDGASDSAKVGFWKDERGYRDLISDLYFRNCIFFHGRDEIFSFTTRDNGNAEGNVISDITVESTIIGNAVGDIDGGHRLAFFIGDGTERITVVDNLFTNVTGRTPFVREYARSVEVINNLTYNGQENQAQVITPSVHFIGNVYRRGPVSDGTFRPIRVQGVGRAYLEDNAIEVGGGDIYYGANSARVDSPLFEGSGVEARPSSELREHLLGVVGPRRQGWVHPLAQTAIDEVASGDAPTRLPDYPGELPMADTGNTVPEAEYVPSAYRVHFPEDTELGATIEGGAWDGYQVWQRVAAWLQAH